MVPRLAIVLTIFGLAYAGLVFHLYQVQLTNGGYYAARAATLYAASDVVQAERGTIYFTDRNGNRLPAVSNKDFPLIFAAPKVIDDPLAAAKAVAPLLNVSSSDLLARFSKKSSSYDLLARKVSPGVAKSVDDLQLKGIIVVEMPERFYPFGRLAAHLLGFVGPDKTGNGESGRYGVEEFYDLGLKGLASSSSDAEAVQSVKPLNLTIDPNIQTEAERILKDLIDKHNAPGGSVIVEEPSTGKILAMGSIPNFDPNSYASSKVADFLNPVTQQVYEPGSIFKVLTMSAGIDTGKITPDTTYYDSGSLALNGYTIRNWDLKVHGTVTMTTVIELSLNTGAAFAERQTGDQAFLSYLQKFGIGEKTGIDLPGEVKGSLRSLLAKGVRPIAFATASYGQGVSTTPLELINAIAAIANGGKLMRPYVNADLQPQVLRSGIISTDTAAKVTGMMVSAIDKAGVANISGYSLAGKTGTANVPDFVNGGYTNNVIDTYVGFGPTSNPRFIVLFKVNEPVGAPHAAETVVPAFRDMAQFLINYYNIAPDRL
jgi:cell division protein FtsI/penicillin-binding protein 2